MDASAQRLYEAARVLRGVIGQTNVAKLLNESPQTVKNWESRGVSDAGAIKAEGVIGCRAYWLATARQTRRPPHMGVAAATTARRALRPTSSSGDPRPVV